jgi:8-oxo-dGTP diphosphatase
MEMLAEIADQDVPTDKTTLVIREASRAVLFDDQGLVPLLFVAKHSYHKLPGGGVEEGEDRLQALSRECLEETGCGIEVEGVVGTTLEYRSRWKLLQTSTCYYGRVTAKDAPKFTKKERHQGFTVVWLPLDVAIGVIEQERPECYDGGFVQKRDLAFLKKAREILVEKSNACPFCSPDVNKRLVAERKSVNVILSDPRLMPGHLLVVPKRHVERLAELHDDERDELFRTVIEFQERILKDVAAGCDIRQHYRPFQEQDRLKVNHLHIHLQPRELYDELYEKCQISEKRIFKDLPTEELDRMRKLLMD